MTGNELHMVENDDNTISCTVIYEGEKVDFIVPASFDQMVAGITDHVGGGEIIADVGEQIIYIPEDVAHA